NPTPGINLGHPLDKPGGRFPLDEGLLVTETGYNYRNVHANHNAGRQELPVDIQYFLDRIETALGRTPMIYTSHMWKDSDMMADPQVMSEYPLWTVYHGEADINGISVGGWKQDWSFIQYAED